ncbi:MAG: hypothetical protein H7276_17670 [Caulobacter sp.]|nr:hypothetical protein [Vitreoscilla sp.]
MAASNPFDKNSSNARVDTGGSFDSGPSSGASVNGQASQVTGTATPAPPANPGLLASAMSNPVTPPVTAGSTANATPGQAAAGQAGSTGYTSAGTGPTSLGPAGAAGSQGYTANTAANSAWNVNDPQTVSGQLSKDMDPSSLLMQKAQADAAQTANGRGLLNSAMAAGAGTGALLDRALQVATPDAQTNANAAQANAASANQTAQFNTGQTNHASEFTAGAANTAGLTNAQLATQVSEQNAAAQNQNAQFNTGQTNAASAFTAGAANTAGLTDAQLATQVAQQNAQNNTQTSLANAASKNSATQFDAAQSLQAQTANQSAAVSTATTAFTAATQTALQNASEADKVQMQSMISGTTLAVTNLEAQYRNQLQASQSSQGMYSTTMAAISGVMNDANLDGPAKQHLIDQQMASLANGLSLQMAIGNVTGVSSLVGNMGSGVTSDGTVPGQAGAPSAPGPQVKVPLPMPATQAQAAQAAQAAAPSRGQQYNVDTGGP